MYNKSKSKSTQSSEKTLSPQYLLLLRYMSMSKKSGYVFAFLDTITKGSATQRAYSKSSIQRFNRELFREGKIRVYAILGTKHRLIITYENFHREKEIFSSIKDGDKYALVHKDIISKKYVPNQKKQQKTDQKCTGFCSKMHGVLHGVYEEPKIYKEIDKEVVYIANHPLPMKKEKAARAIKKTTKSFKKNGHDEIEGLYSLMSMEDYKRVCGNGLDAEEFSPLVKEFGKKLAETKCKNALKLMAQMKRDGYTDHQDYKLGLAGLVYKWCREAVEEKEKSASSRQQAQKDRVKSMIMSSSQTWVKEAVSISPGYVELKCLSTHGTGYRHSGMSTCIDLSDPDVENKILHHLDRTGRVLGKRIQATF